MRELCKLSDGQARVDAVRVTRLGPSVFFQKNTPHFPNKKSQQTHFEKISKHMLFKTQNTGWISDIWRA